MGASLVLLSKSADGVTTVTLNDPDSRNAMSEKMAGEFHACVKEIRGDAGTRVVVLTGAGKAFSGGGHLDMLFEKVKIAPDTNRKLMESFYDRFLSITEVPVPVIAAINGHAVGAGLCLSLACDIRLASSEAKLGLNFVLLGLHPGMGVTYFLPRLVGPARAAESLYAGKIISAEAAAVVRLINEVVHVDVFSSRVNELAKQIANAGPQAVRQLKASLRDSPKRNLAECLLREAECQAKDYAGSEFLEGITAAREKRPARFGG